MKEHNHFLAEIVLHFRIVEMEGTDIPYRDTAIQLSSENSKTHATRVVFWWIIGLTRDLMADKPMVPQSKTLPFVFCGRSFLATEIELIREVVADFSSLSLSEIARTICELLEWKRPNGRLKNHECRLLLEKLSAAGLVNLPALRESGPRGPRVVLPTENGVEQEPFSGSVVELAPLSLTVVHSGTESALWNELVDRYHYLGYRVPVGANLRYLVRSGSAKQVLACLLWSSPAWKMAARDSWIGWTNEERPRNLQLVVNNSRFLILPWVRVRNLASTILSLCTRQLPMDWEGLYGCRPLLLETLVDAQFRGTSYQATNWIYLGETRGRGRMDRHHEAHGRAVKQIYVYPLCRNVQRRLRQTRAPRCVNECEEKP